MLTWDNLGHADKVWVGTKNPLSWPTIFRKIFFCVPPLLSFPPYLILTHPQPSIIAYAACCQLDSEDRPLAGAIVYCAQHLTSSSLSHSDIVMVTAA